MNTQKLDTLLEKIALHRTYQLTLSKPQHEIWENFQQKVKMRKPGFWGIEKSVYHLFFRKKTAEEMVLLRGVKTGNKRNSITYIVLFIRTLEKNENTTTLEIKARVKYIDFIAPCILLVIGLIGILGSIIFVGPTALFSVPLICILTYILYGVSHYSVETAFYDCIKLLKICQYS